MATATTTRTRRQPRSAHPVTPRGASAPAYRPHVAQTAAPSSTAERATTARTHPPAAARCEECARTRRFERRAGQLIRRALLLGACAALTAVSARPATLTAGSGAANPATTKPVPAEVRPADAQESPSAPCPLLPTLLRPCPEPWGTGDG